MYVPPRYNADINGDTHMRTMVLGIRGTRTFNSYRYPHKLAVVLYSVKTAPGKGAVMIQKDSPPPKCDTHIVLLYASADACYDRGAAIIF